MLKKLFQRWNHPLIADQPGEQELPEWLDKVAPDLKNTRKLLGPEAYRHLISLAYMEQPDPNCNLCDIAQFLCNSGLPDEGLEVYRALMARYDQPPEWMIVFYLLTLMFGSPDIQTDKLIHDEHVKWSRQFLRADVYKQYANPLTLNRRLKIGYTCHFVTEHVSTNLLLPLLKAHHRDRVEIFMYSDEPTQTGTGSAHALVDHWRDTHKMSHDEFCEAVRADEIDILMELNGHGLFNRYPAIARHPVPVQVAWYNYVCTTGVPGMDYCLVGGDIDIAHLQPYYSETIIQKRGSSHAMPIGEQFPPVGPPPFEKNGYITFGCFGQAHKVSRDQILLWCEVLKRVPGSKFFMKAQKLGEAGSRAAFIHHFAAGGIPESRLILEGNSDYATLLRCYERVDISLDTYPFNGGNTTIETLVQGVPVISRIGDRYSSQVAFASVGSSGHPELLAKTKKEFVRKAVELAKDKERLRRYRQTLRDNYRSSIRGDVEKFITELEDTYEEMWRRYVKKATLVASA